MSGSGRGVAAIMQRDSEPDEPQVLSTLREVVAAGEHKLDPILGAIADAAMLLTGASGVALAMWKDGAMVCRARSGETAPPLGARLSADTGISGECLRSGKIQHCVDTEKNHLVNVEVCRTLGLRSIAVLPIQGERGNNGILEAFSTEAGAFTPHHLAVLEQLAGLAEKARAAKPVGASPVAAPTVVKAPAEKPGPVGILPASDRFVDFLHVLVGGRPLVLGAAGLGVALLLGLVIWLGWRGGDGSENKAHAATPATAAGTANTGSANTLRGGSLQNGKPSDWQLAGQRLPDNDAVWKPNPGGQLLTASGKPSAARTVKEAAALDAAEERQNKDARTASAADGVSGPPHGTGSTESHNSDASANSGIDSASAVNGAGKDAAANQEELAALTPPALAEGQPSSALNVVLSSQALVPTLSQTRISRGITGGELIHRVPPVYPVQAKSLRVEGKVVLDAMVMEDGTVGDLKIVQGAPTLAASAVEAVKQWRYKPFVLDGKVVKSSMRIVVDFRLPR
ncbi:MAG: TonB family protein [Terriglobales bacterium]